MQGKILRLVLACAAALVVLCAFGGTASATHFTGGSLSWTEGASQEARFDLRVGWRRDYPGFTPNNQQQQIGDILAEPSGLLAFGDGASQGNIRYRVDAVDPIANYFIGTGLPPAAQGDDPPIVHQYVLAGQFVARLQGCCTRSDLRNYADQAFLLESRVNFATRDASPAVSIVPIVDVRNSGVQRFFVPATDPGGGIMRWRLSPCFGCNPAGLSIDASTGEVSWDTTGRPLGLYHASVIVDSLDAQGASQASTTSSFLIRINPNQGPDWIAPTPAQGTVVTVPAQTGVAVDLAAKDADGDAVTINHVGLPPGATLTPAVGDPGTAQFNWTPGAGHVGDHLVTFTATDAGSPPASAAPRTITIRVVENAPPTARLKATPTAGDHPLVVNFDGSDSSDPEGALTAWTLSFGDGSPSMSGAGAPPSSLPHTYADSGHYLATLIVFDAGGRSGVDSVPITVANRPPLFVAPTPLHGSITRAIAGEELVIPVRAEDPDGDALSHSAPVLPPGAVLEPDGSGVRVVWTPPPSAVGTHQVALRVADDQTPAGTDERRFLVSVEPNAPPLASLTATPSSGPWPLAVTFDGSQSNDPEGNLASWTLDFGDGSPVVGGGGTPPADIAHTYGAPGTYQATLTVGDAVGQVDTAVVTIVVERAATRLVAHPALAELAPGFKIRLAPSATLTRADGMPLAGRTIAFTAAGRHICSAQTNAAGTAACTGLLPAIQATLGLGYDAAFGGDDLHEGARATGTLIRVGVLSL